MGPALWLALARDELRAAELLAEHGIAPLSSLHADQAIEKALWALHIHRGGDSAERRASEDATHGANLTYPAEAAALPPGGERRGLATALAALALHSTHRHPGSPMPEADLMQETVQVAHRLLDRITERVYGDET